MVNKSGNRGRLRAGGRAGQCSKACPERQLGLHDALV